MIDTEKVPIRIGVSTCLLGEKVRFDAGHKKDRYLTDVLGKYFEWVPVCPELEVGMGVPRESVRLVGSTDAPRMVGTKSGTDWTDRMVKYSVERVHRLRGLNLSGIYTQERFSKLWHGARSAVCRQRHAVENRSWFVCLCVY